MTAAPETKPFQAEVQELLDLMIHSLYTHEEIFVRELVSNASDALDKLRHAALTDATLLPEDEELCITLEADEEGRTLTIVDNGIGMSHEDLVSSLGTIARSGTKNFLKELKEKGGENNPELIGQFGVGFYSGFMVASKMEVETMKAGESQGWRWSSEAGGSYTIEEVEGLSRGTRIVLHLKDLDEDSTDYTKDFKLRELVTRYSDFVEYPIRLGEDTLNSMKPIWTRPKSEISEEEHGEFYRHLTKDFMPPLEAIHFKAEGTIEYTALLYLPSAKPMDLFGGGHQEPKSKVSLYVRRVQVSEECEDLLPPWLRFVRGVVEASDLPLNVSREILQSNPHVRAIQKRLTKKVIATLGTLMEKEREKYETFWSAFGATIKEGICSGGNEEDRLAKLSLFHTDTQEGWTTLDAYVARCPADQEKIFYVSGSDRATLAKTPHLEAFKKRGWEVLFLTDPIDEWLVDSLPEYAGKPLVSVHAGNALGESEDEGKTKNEQYAEAFEHLAEHLGAGVKEVRLSSRLTDSPGVLVSESGGPRPHMERMMREMHGQDMPTARILEINPDHPLIQRLLSMDSSEGGRAALDDFADLLYGQVLLAEGSPLPDPSRFSKLLSELMVGASPAN